MKIIKLEAENVKRLRAVRIEPSGDLVVVGGDNAAGKSSVLDSIMYALAGKASLPTRTVRDGEKKACIACDVGDFVVRRTITAAGGGTLKVETKDGSIKKSPQTFLDSLLGKLAYDPLAFCGESPKRQIEILREMAGLDFEALDAQRATAYEARAECNRDAKRLAAQLERLPAIADVPETPVDVGALVLELRARQEGNRKNAEARFLLENLKKEASAADDLLLRKRGEIEELEKRCWELTSRVIKGESVVSTLIDLDDTEIAEALSSAEHTNTRFWQGQQRREIETERDRAAQAALVHATEIAELDAKKQQLIINAALPVDGLLFNDDGVTYNGVPLEQCATSEQLRVSVAIGLALNPTLKVLLVREGSLLDEPGLRLLGKMAHEAQAQIWVERVSKGSEVSLIIEDGEIAQ